MGLAFKPLEGPWVMRQIVGKKFQSNTSMQADIFGFVNHSHATGADLPDHAVVRDGLADHVPNMLWGDRRQVNESRGVRSGSRCFRPAVSESPSRRFSSLNRVRSQAVLSNPLSTFFQLVIDCEPSRGGARGDQA